MRISTEQYFGMDVGVMNQQQAQLAESFSAISSGNALTDPSMNPLGAAEAVQLSTMGAALSQYTTNQNNALTELGSEDSTLSSVSGTLTSINTALIGFGNGIDNDSNRAAAAKSLESLRDNLLSLANTTDGQGNSLFAGFQATTQAFTTNANGSVTYNGDAGSRTVQISGSTSVAINDSGSSVFQSVSSTNANPVATGNASNTGTGVIDQPTVTAPGNPANADSYQIAFAGAGATLTYTVTDTTTGVAGTPQPYTAGSNITLGGQTVSISGTPAAGDTFGVQPANQAGTDVFANLNAIITALQQPTSSNPAASATLQNALNTSMTQLANTMANVTSVHVSVGGREQQVEAMQTVTQSNSTQTTTNLDDLTQTDIIAASSKFTLQQAALTASQQAFVQIQNVSLFQFINN